MEAEPDPDDLQPFDPGASLPFQGFTSPPRHICFSPYLQILREEEEEAKTEEAAKFQLVGQRGDNLDPGGARGSLTETHPINLPHASVEEQALYYDALLSAVDQNMQEADRALQALQGATVHVQL